MPKKLILDCEEKLWHEILKYKIECSLKNNNETIVKLVKKGLKND